MAAAWLDSAAHAAGIFQRGGPDHAPFRWREASRPKPPAGRRLQGVPETPFLCRGHSTGPQRLAQSVGNGVVPEPADPPTDSRVSRLPTRWRSAAAEGLSHIGLS